MSRRRRRFWHATQSGFRTGHSTETALL